MPRGEPLGTRDLARTLAQVVRPERLAVDGAGEERVFGEERIRAEAAEEWGERGGGDTVTGTVWSGWVRSCRDPRGGTHIRCTTGAAFPPASRIGEESRIRFGREGTSGPEWC